MFRVHLVLCGLLLLSSDVLAGGSGWGVDWQHLVLENTRCVSKSQCLPLLDLPNIADVSCVITGSQKGHCRVLIGNCNSTEDMVGIWNPLFKFCEYYAIIPSQIMCVSSAECPSYYEVSQYGNALATSVSTCLILPGSVFGYCELETQSVECCAYGVSLNGTCLPVPLPACAFSWDCLDPPNTTCVQGVCQNVSYEKLKVNHVDLTNLELVNGQSTDLYKFTVSASDEGDIAIKQFKLLIAWKDFGEDDSLMLSNMQVFLDGTNITDVALLMDEDGNDVHKNVGLIETDERLVVTWKNELSIAAGSTRTITVRGMPSGFHGNLNEDTNIDVVVVRLVADTVATDTNRFLNSEIDQSPAQAQIIELASAAGSGYLDGQSCAFIWSDLSAVVHSEDFDTLSSGDWYNSYKVQDLPLPEETWVH